VVVYDEVVESFSEAPKLGVREQVAMALVNKALPQLTWVEAPGANC
jgi:hypothetical protein